MSFVDINRVINGTPEKVLMNNYNKMKENYTEASAQEFYQSYSNEPLSFLLENSRLIFSEPYFGCDYYKEAVLNNANCSFTSIESEYEKVQDFLNENGSLMSETQRAKYTELKNGLSALMENTKNTRIYADYIKEKIDDTFEEKLSNAVFKNNEDEIKELFESVENPVVFFTYAPFVMKESKSTLLNNLTSTFFEKASVPESYDEVQWTTYVETAICGNKLSNDKNYLEAVNSIGNRNVRFMFEYYMNTSLDNKIEELVEEKVNVSNVVYDSPVSAMNSIFSDMYESAIDFADNDSRTQIDIYKGIVYESSLNILISEYQTCNDTSDDANGYTILKESMSIDDAFKHLRNHDRLQNGKDLFTDKDQIKKIWK